jgi:hypothetical protein
MRRHQPEVLYKGERVGISVPGLLLFDRLFMDARVRDCIMDQVRLFEGREPVDEIARMLAGEKVPETALRHARELLAQAGNA